MKDFFVSYNRHDRAWAEWIAWTLEAAGYSTVIQAWDFRAGGNFVLDMQQAASEANRTIAVLSETYLKSDFTQPQWAAAFAQDPTGKHRTLVPVRVKECQPTGLLAPIGYIDLVDVAEAEAQDVLLRSLAQDRPKPDQKPRFPGSAASQSDRPKPVFPPSIPSNLPLVSAIFVGRDNELERLHTQMQSKATIAISAVSGMGGIGKTELAAQYALQQRDMGTYPGGICWLKAREDLSAQIVLFARSHLALTIPEDLELAAQVSHCWRNWHPGETLIVFDDVQQYGDIAPILPPQRSQFRVLLTTRLTLQSSVQNFKITVLSEEKAIELLRAFATQNREGNDPRFLQEIADLEQQLCQWLGYLPLGLELVGRYLAWDEDVTLSVLWQRLQEKRTDAIALKQTYPGMTASDGVAAAFELSWQTLHPLAQQLARLLSLFALAEIPWTLVEACLPDVDAEELQRLRNDELVGLHLLERTGQGTYQLHQLLREFFAAKREQRAKADVMKQTLCRVMVAEAEKISQTPNLEEIQQATPSIPHLAEVATTLTNWLTDENLITLPNRIACFYRGQGAYAQAEPWLKQCCTKAETRLGANHLNVATSLNDLAKLLRVQGRYPDAEPLYLRSLAIRERQLGADAPGVATSLNDLAGLRSSQKRYTEAETLYLRALAIREQQLGADHPDLATSLNNLAVLYQLRGRFNEAESLYNRALTISEHFYEENHFEVAEILYNLATFHYCQKEYSKAEPLLLRSLPIYERRLGERHPAVAIAINSLANLYQLQGRYVEAEPLYVRALEILLNRLSKDHHHTQTVQQSFCLFLQQVMQAGQTAQLSDHPVTRDLLRQIIEGNGE